jgi:hypothetical protein
VTGDPHAILSAVQKQDPQKTSAVTKMSAQKIRVASDPHEPSPKVQKAAAKATRNIKRQIGMIKAARAKS